MLSIVPVDISIVKKTIHHKVMNKTFISNLKNEYLFDKNEYFVHLWKFFLKPVN